MSYDREAHNRTVDRAEGAYYLLKAHGAIVAHDVPFFNGPVHGPDLAPMWTWWPWTGDNGPMHGPLNLDD